ncbi:MAG TPA: type II secretion system minor pseudopilin GspK [Burkholderiaceae bacterium]|nr:type II secretion system minor pseudopilin GspK [Burkholderiaceae bacterium]
MKSASRRGQRGVAIVSALLVAALITVLTIQWFAAQAAQAQAVETQRAAVQARWLVVAATDWALMLLREDANSMTDSLQEVWATPLARTRITDASGRLEAFVSGRIEDAQGRFNLADLVKGGAIDDEAVAGLQRLMVVARLDASKAERIAEAMLLVTPAPPAPPQREAGAPQADKDRTLSVAPPAPRIKNVLDLVGKNDLTEGDLIGLEPYVVVVPKSAALAKKRTPINVNTASAPAIASASEELARIAEAVVARRERISRFTNVENFRGNFSSLSAIPPAELQALIDVRSQYFMATGRIELGRVDMTRQALIERQPDGLRLAKVVWAREL